MHRNGASDIWNVIHGQSIGSQPAAFATLSDRRLTRCPVSVLDPTRERATIPGNDPVARATSTA